LLELRKSGGKTYYLRYTDTGGTQRQHRIGNADLLSLADARKTALAVRKELALGRNPGEEKQLARTVPTLGQFTVEFYVPFIKTYKRSWKSDISYLKNHLLPDLGDKSLHQITKTDVLAMHRKMNENGYAPGTANRCLILLRYIFNLAIKWEVPGVVTNPARAVDLFENKDARETYLTQDQVRRLFVVLKASENPMLANIIQMLLLTGARKREVLDAKWSCFNFERKQWLIPVTKSGKPRHVPLSDDVMRFLQTLRRDDECEWVFPNAKTGKPYVSIFKTWDTARQLANMGEVRIHDLRHSYASFLVNAGRSIYEVQKLLGHTQIRTTQRYAHLSQETLLEATNIASSAIGDVF
jgi:integrase